MIYKTISLPSVGELTYNEKVDWYETYFKIKEKDVLISILDASADELKEVIAFADKQLQAMFYDKMLLEMEAKMIALKNDVWLDEDEETGEEEEPVTLEDFRKRISISSITFYDDCSSAIYCDDDDLFFGHSIEINVDKNGNYKNANLAG